jgi:hypothetical protein
MTTTTLSPLPAPLARAPRAPRAVPRTGGLDEWMLTRLVAVVGSACAAVLLGYAVVALPNRLMLSEYVHVPGGLVPFVGGLLALAVAAAAVARLVSHLGGPAALVLRAGASAAVAAAAFPTDESRGPAMSLSAQIHRYAALVVFVSLPLGGWLAVRGNAGLRWRLVRGVAGVSSVVVAATLLLHPGSPVARVLGHPGWEGGVQRLMAASDVVLVALTALVAGSRRTGAVRAVGEHAACAA